MLSTENIKSVDHAVEYFMGGENYYHSSQMEEYKGYWYGKGAERLGLAGEITERDFIDLLSGKLPNGEQLGKLKDNKMEHRPGFDLTLSVPKSLSLFITFCPDLEFKRKIISIIKNASEKTMSLIEGECVQARQTAAGNTTFIRTKNITSVMLMHSTSRCGDPQWHMHSLVMNATQKSDGNWRSLASSKNYYGENATKEVNGFFERVRYDKKYYGAIFRSELAYELKKLNIPLAVFNDTGYFEIVGISEKSIKTFSDRSEQIEQYMNKFGLSGAKAKAMATLTTRPSKKDIDHENLESWWREKAEQSQIDPYQEVRNIYDNLRSKSIPEAKLSLTSSLEAKEAVQYAIEILSENHYKIRNIQLINVALKHALGGRVNVEAVLSEINALKQKSELIPISKNNGELYFTTKKIFDAEQNVRVGLTAELPARSVISKSKIDKYLKSRHGLSLFQKSAIREVISSGSLITGIEGSSRSGKTELLKPMLEVANKCGLDVVMLYPNNSGMLSLKRTIQSADHKIIAIFKEHFDKNQYSSVQKFIFSEKSIIDSGRELTKNRAIFVDNAHMLSAVVLSDLKSIAEQSKSRLILLGDKKSISHWQSGNIFRFMAENGLHVIEMSKIEDPHITNDIHASYEDSLSGNINRAFEKIEHRIFSIENPDERLALLAAHYAHLPEEKRTKTLVLMPTRAMSREANLKIRQELKSQGKLSASDIRISTLLPRNMKSAEYRMAKNYHERDWVRFNEDYSSLKIKKGDYLKITHIDRGANRVYLTNKQGNSIKWSPHRIAGKSDRIEVFEPVKLEIAAGELLVCRRTDKKLGVLSGEKFKVLAVTKTHMKLERSNQKVISVSFKDGMPQHFDYRYAQTPYAAHDQKPDNIICYQNASTQKGNARGFFKILSQANEQVWIYTENKNELLKNLQSHSGNQETLIDTLLGDAKYVSKDSMSKSDHAVLLEKAVTGALAKLQQDKVELLPEERAKEAVTYAIAHLSEREAAFTHKNVIQTALKYALSDVNRDLIQSATEEVEATGELIRGIYSTNGTRWTTREAVSIEREILTLAHSDKTKLDPILPKNIIEDYLNTNHLKSDHRVAIHEWMSASDRIVILQGYAGTGKTTLLDRTQELLKKEISPLLHDNGYKLLCLAPTHTAVNELRSHGLTAQTLDSFIVENQIVNTQSSENVVKHGNRLIIALDENSMTSNRRERDFLKIAHNIEARVLLVGDHRQFAAIESGKPHSLLQGSGIKTVHLTEIIRQKNSVILEAVQDMYRNDYQKAFTTLQNSIHEIKARPQLDAAVSGELTEILKDQDPGSLLKDDPAARQDKVASEYLALAAVERARTFIITPGNEVRIALNEKIREGLVSEGILTGNPVSVTILAPRDMSEIEKTQVLNYRIGDLLRFGIPDKQLAIEKGQYLKVTRINTENSLLTLSFETGKAVIWSPRGSHESYSSGIEVYTPQKRTLMVGDLIRWTRSDKTLGILGADVSRIQKIAEDKIWVRQTKIADGALVEQGESFCINYKERKFQHWDLSYVMTSYAAQSKSIHRVFALMESYSKNLSNQASLLINVSRATDHFTLYTDNKAALLERILRNSGVKSCALETIGEVKINLEAPEKVKSASNPDRRSNAREHNERAVPHQQKWMRTRSKEKDPHAEPLSLKMISDLLHEKAEEVVTQVLGKPRHRNGTHFTYSYSEIFGGQNNKQQGGSFSIAISGPKQGLWNCFKTTEGGNLITLIQKKYGYDLENAKRRAMELLGMSPGDLLKHKPRPTSQENVKGSDASNTQNLTAEQKKRIASARKIVRESVPVAGTLGEKYLKEQRGIDVENLPESVRFHGAVRSGPNGNLPYPALVVIAKSDRGEVQGIQTIYLDKDTGKKANVQLVKESWGVFKNSSVDLPKSQEKSSITYLAEGPETALSIWQSIDRGFVKATLGKSNFKHPSAHSLHENVVLCIDNDGSDPKQLEPIHKAAMELQKQGKHVWIARPEEGFNDYNDLLKAHGAMRVKQSIEQAIPYEKFISKTVLPEADLSPINRIQIEDTPIDFDKKLALKCIQEQQITQVPSALQIDLSKDQISEQFLQEYSRNIDQKPEKFKSRGDELAHNISNNKTPKNDGVHQEIVKSVDLEM